MKSIQIMYASYKNYAVINMNLIAILLISTLIVTPISAFASSLTQECPSTFSNIYEPSGVVQLADGRLFIVEDEVHHAMNVLTIGADADLIEDADANKKMIKAFGKDYADLEAITSDNRGYIYATTSHSTLKKGKRDPNRERMVRFKVQNQLPVDITEFTSLRDELETSSMIVNDIEARLKGKLDFDDLNIEGLTYHPQTHNLMIGLRTPTAGEMGIIIAITNPDDVFDHGASPIFDKPIFINLNGGGIRSLHFNQMLNQFIIANEIENKKGKNRSKIWKWSGQPVDHPILMDLPELEALKNIEGIAAVTINGKQKLLFTADDGVEKKNKPASYCMIDYAKFE